MELNEILVIKKSNEIIVSHDGKKMVCSIEDFTDMTIEEIKKWYIKEILNKEVD